MKTIQFLNTGFITYGSNTSVSPGLPTQAIPGDTIIVIASIRNSGTGMPQAPAGWKTLLLYGNLGVFAKMLAYGETTIPAITFAGGVANATTIAGSFAIRYCRDVDNILHASSTVLNGAVQDIATPALTVTSDGCLIVGVGWKQDDWVTVTPPTGFTIASYGSTTTGDDAGQASAYKLQTTAANIGIDSFVIGGGAVAISRGAMLALLPYVTTWTSITGASTPCSFADSFNEVSEAASDAIAALDTSIDALVNPPAGRVTSGAGALTDSLVAYTSVAIDPTGFIDLVRDPNTIPLLPAGIWNVGMNVNITFTGTNGNAGRLGCNFDSQYQTSVRDIDTTLNPTTGGGTGTASYLWTSYDTYNYQMGTEVGGSGAGIPSPLTIKSASMYAFRVSD